MSALHTLLESVSAPATSHKNQVNSLYFIHEAPAALHDKLMRIILKLMRKLKLMAFTTIMRVSILS